jgi:hypothetical protein
VVPSFATAEKASSSGFLKISIAYRYMKIMNLSSFAKNAIKSSFNEERGILVSDLHQLQVTRIDQSETEKLDPRFIVDGLLRAREKTVEVLEAIRGQLKEGLSETEARFLALSIFKDFGVTKHWHQPYIRFGEGTALSFREPLSNHQLKVDDVYHLDVGPVWPSQRLDIEPGLEYEGDYGDTFIFGKNPEAQKMIDVLHEVYHLVKREWEQKKISGEKIYQFFKEQVENSGYIFIEKVEGHRISDFPHQKYTRKRLSNIEFAPAHSLWVLEGMICHPKIQMGAFYEDLMT